MKILVIGSGGREHALAWRFSRSPSVSQVYVAPGNPGTQQEKGVSNVPINVNDHAALLHFAIDQQIDLTVVGPEQPIVDGIRELFDDHGAKCFAPTQKAGRLESSKSFAKSFMQRHHIPTAKAHITEDLADAIDYIRQQEFPVVIKADGLAAGKGVVVTSSMAQAQATVKDMLSGESFGNAGKRVVIEEFLAGEEASFIVMTDGKNALPFATSQDHKPVFDGDRGPNTGGMGAYSPAPVVSPTVHERVMADIVTPTIKGMATEGTPFLGFLYVGLMIDGNSPSVVEYNCRFGDPEAQPVLYRLESDLVHLCLQAMDDSLAGQTMQFSDRCTVAIVLASEGYPGKYQTELPITGNLEEDENTKIFHAGTRLFGDQLVTSGGRVLTVVGAGDSFNDAKRHAYHRANTIQWQGLHMRTDIGWRVESIRTENHDRSTV